MKTFKEFIEEITYIVEETTQERLDRIRRQRQIDARRMQEIQRKGGYDVQRDRFSRANPQQAAQNAQAAQRVKDMQRSLERGGWKPEPLEGNFRMPNPATRAVTPRFAGVNQLKGAAGLAGRAATVYATYEQGKKVFNPKDNIITSVQNLGTSIGNQGVPISRQMKYKGSDPSAVAINRKIDAANRYENEKLKAELRGAKRNVISDVGGAGGKVSTNKPYKATIGGFTGTSTRGQSGQRMLRVDLGVKSEKDKPSFNIFNKNTWSKPETGTRYAATLGRHKGTVTYDSSGKRTFTALTGRR